MTKIGTLLDPAGRTLGQPSDDQPVSPPQRAPTMPRMHRGGSLPADSVERPSSRPGSRKSQRSPATFAEIPRLDRRYTSAAQRQRTITVMGSSRSNPSIQRETEIAERVVGELVARGYNVVHGCGSAGIMGAAYEAAYAASRSVERHPGVQPGESLAIIKVPPWGDEDLSRTRAIGTAASEGERIGAFSRVANAFLVFPGGASTLEEATTLIANNKYCPKDQQPKKVVLVGWAYFAALVAQYEQLEAAGLLGCKPSDLFMVVDSADEILAAFPLPTP